VAAFTSLRVAELFRSGAFPELDRTWQYASVRTDAADVPKQREEAERLLREVTRFNDEKLNVELRDLIEICEDAEHRGFGLLADGP
jgi:hypothetical protein